VRRQKYQKLVFFIVLLFSLVLSVQRVSRVSAEGWYCPLGDTYPCVGGYCTRSGVCQGIPTDVTKYYCDYNGNLYPDEGTCNNQCVEVGTCTEQGTSTVYTCPLDARTYTEEALCRNNCVQNIPRSCSLQQAPGNCTEQAGSIINLSGGYDAAPNNYITSITGQENRIDIQSSNGNIYTITVSGASVSGSVSFQPYNPNDNGPSPASCTKVQSDGGNSLIFYGRPNKSNEHVIGTLTFSQGVHVTGNIGGGGSTTAALVSFQAVGGTIINVILEDIRYMVWYEQNASGGTIFSGGSATYSCDVNGQTYYSLEDCQSACTTEGWLCSAPGNSNVYSSQQICEDNCFESIQYDCNSQVETMYLCSIDEHTYAGINECNYACMVPHTCTPQQEQSYKYVCNIDMHEYNTFGECSNRCKETATCVYDDPDDPGGGGGSGSSPFNVGTAEVYTFGNGDYINQALMAMRGVVGSDDYRTLITTSIMIGMFAGIIYWVGKGK
jgi:hypothetical protein